MLVVMKHRDIAFLLKLTLNLKAAGRGNILQVDSAKRAGNQVNSIDKFVHILRSDAKGKSIYAAESLEQDAFPLHDGHPRLRADISEAQHRAAVSDDSAEVVSPCQLIAPVDILLDFETRLCHAGGIGQREVVLCGNRNGGNDLNLSFYSLVQFQGFRCIIHNFFPFLFILILFPN